MLFEFVRELSGGLLKQIAQLAFNKSQSFFSGVCRREVKRSVQPELFQKKSTNSGNTNLK